MSGVGDVSPDERARRLTHPTAQVLLETARRLIVEVGARRAGPIAVAQAAGYARGLASYYFGTKDTMLAALLDDDASARADVLEAALSPAATREEVVNALITQFVTYREDGSYIMFDQLRTYAFSSPTVCAAYQRTRLRWRGTLADQLAKKADEGVIYLVGDPDTVAALLTALGRGLADELQADTELDPESTVGVARGLIRAALSPPPEDARSGSAPT